MLSIFFGKHNARTTRYLPREIERIAIHASTANDRSAAGSEPRAAIHDHRPDQIRQITESDVAKNGPKQIENRITSDKVTAGREIHIIV